jgi:hypothetical protein
MAKRSADDAALVCRGGSSQKAKWVQAFASDEAPALAIGNTSSQPATPNKLSAFLIEKWGWGLISAPFLQQVASLSIEDCANHPDLKVLAKLGTSGKYSGKSHWELLAKLNPMSIDHALTNFTIWYRVGRKLRKDAPIMHFYRTSFLHCCIRSTEMHSRSTLWAAVQTTCPSFGKLWSTIQHFVIIRCAESTGINLNSYL